MLKNIKKTNWKKVLAIWQENEEKNPAWIEHYQKKGFSSWKEWRQIYIKPLKLNKLNWRIGELKNPYQEIPKFYGGPFKAWHKYFYSLKNKSSLTFKELAALPEIKNNKRFLKLINNFPKQTNLIAIKIQGKIIIIEGMHRCVAMALMKNKQALNKTKIRMAWAKYPNKKLPILGI